MNANEMAAGKTALQVYSYEGSNVTFSQGENVMVNANDMAKAFGKLPADFLKTKRTKEFLKELSAMKKIIASDLVQVVNGDNGGTWMHEDVAMEFARWLSPKFAIWTNDRIKELLRTGVATVSDDNETIARAMQILQQRLDTKERELATARQNLLDMQERVDQAELYMDDNDRLAEYAFSIIFHGKSYTFSQLAPELGFPSASDLTQHLCKLGILYRDGERLHPTEPHAHHTWFVNRTYRRYDSHGRTVEKPYLVVTEMGRFFLHNRLNPDYVNHIDEKGGAQ